MSAGGLFLPLLSSVLPSSFAFPPSAWPPSVLAVPPAFASAPTAAVLFFLLLGRARTSAPVLKALSSCSCRTAAVAAPWQVLFRLANLSALRCSVDVLPELLERALPRFPMVRLRVAGEGIVNSWGSHEQDGDCDLLLEPEMATAANRNGHAVRPFAIFIAGTSSAYLAASAFIAFMAFMGVGSKISVPQGVA